MSRTYPGYPAAHWDMRRRSALAMAAMWLRRWKETVRRVSPMGFAIAVYSLSREIARAASTLIMITSPGPFVDGFLTRAAPFGEWLTSRAAAETCGLPRRRSAVAVIRGLKPSPDNGPDRVRTTRTPSGSVRGVRANRRDVRFVQLVRASCKLLYSMAYFQDRVLSGLSWLR